MRDKIRDLIQKPCKVMLHDFECSDLMGQMNLTSDVIFCEMLVV